MRNQRNKCLFCEEIGQIDLSCTVFCDTEGSKRTREWREKRQKIEELEAIRGHATKLRGVSAVVLRFEPIHLHWLRYIRENTCTPLNCIVSRLQRSLACLPECSSIWQRGKWTQKEHLHSSKRPSYQTVLMKVVTVPKHRAALLIQHI